MRSGGPLLEDESKEFFSDFLVREFHRIWFLQLQYHKNYIFYQFLAVFKFVNSCEESKIMRHWASGKDRFPTSEYPSREQFVPQEHFRAFSSPIWWLCRLPARFRKRLCPRNCPVVFCFSKWMNNIWFFSSIVAYLDHLGKFAFQWSKLV